MRDWLIALSIIAAVAIGSVCVLSWYYNSTEQIELTGVVIEKYMYEEADMVIVVTDDAPGIGIPITSMTYLLVLDDGSKHEVSWEIFWEHKTGDFYTYTKRVWK